MCGIKFEEEKEVGIRALLHKTGEIFVTRISPLLLLEFK